MEQQKKNQMSLYSIMYNFTMTSSKIKGTACSIDYRATYVHGIGNGCAPLIVLHWAALIPSSKYIAFTKAN